MNAGTLSVLLAENDEADVMFLQRAFKYVGFRHRLDVASDGMAAIEFLSRVKATPSSGFPR